MVGDDGGVTHRVGTVGSDRDLQAHQTPGDDADHRAKPTTSTDLRSLWLLVLPVALGLCGPAGAGRAGCRTSAVTDLPRFGAICVPFAVTRVTERNFHCREVVVRANRDSPSTLGTGW